MIQKKILLGTQELWSAEFSPALIWVIKISISIGHKAVPLATLIYIPNLWIGFCRTCLSVVASQNRPTNSCLHNTPVYHHNPPKQLQNHNYLRRTPFIIFSLHCFANYFSFTIRNLYLHIQYVLHCVATNNNQTTSITISDYLYCCILVFCIILHVIFPH